MKKRLIVISIILTPALLILATNVLAQSPTPNPQVNVNVDVAPAAGSNTNVNTNTNTNNINIQNTQNQTQTVTIGQAQAVPRVLPATGASPWTTVAMLGAIPLGLYLRRYPIG